MGGGGVSLRRGVDPTAPAMCAWAGAEPEGGAALSMDCEDMFKEITKKLYGEEAADFPADHDDDDLRPEEHLTAWGLAALMQNGFPPPGILQANFTPRTDPSAEDRWTPPDEPLAWAHSRVASYNPAQRLFKCADCECVGFLARVAEHWLGTHSQARVFHCPLPHCGYAAAWLRAVRAHLAREHQADAAAAEPLLRDNPALDDVTRHLQRLKARVDARRRPPATAAPVEPEPEPEPSGKRYACTACPYATDRRDLFTRHENIHRDEKPFHCYLCQKQFNRADHVKKHFLRMHRDHPYDLNRIRRQHTGRVVAQAPAAVAPAPVVAQQYYKPAVETPVVEFRPPAAVAKPERPPPGKPDATQKANVAAKRKGERRYACCYCSWSGVDNWCLKRHLNTHLKPFACALCEYKAARAERLATHVAKVHNKKACAKCPFLGDDQQHLASHVRESHHVEARGIKVPAGVAAVTARATFRAEGARRRETRAQGAARLFGYLEASDGSGDEFEAAGAAGAAGGAEFVVPAPVPAPAPPPAPPAFARDKENAAPLALHHDHCLRY